MMLRPHRFARTLLSVAAAALVAGIVAGQSIQREPHDGREPFWTRGPANVPYAEEAHVLTGQNAHSLPTSEYIRINAGANGELNPSVYYNYATSQALMTDDMTAQESRCAPVARAYSSWPVSSCRANGFPSAPANR